MFNLKFDKYCLDVCMIDPLFGGAEISMILALVLKANCPS